MNVSAYVRTICLLGEGRACCRYLIGDATGFHCAKKVATLKAELDRRVEAAAMVARADNCEGVKLEEVL